MAKIGKYNSLLNQHTAKFEPDRHSHPGPSAQNGIAFPLAPSSSPLPLPSPLIITSSSSSSPKHDRSLSLSPSTSKKKGEIKERGGENRAWSQQRRNMLVARYRGREGIPVHSLVNKRCGASAPVAATLVTCAGTRGPPSPVGTPRDLTSGIFDPGTPVCERKEGGKYPFTKRTSIFETSNALKTWEKSSKLPLTPSFLGVCSALLKRVTTRGNVIWRISLPQRHPIFMTYH